MAPVLILFILVMPWVIRLLYTESFLPAVPMSVCAVFYMFFKAVTTPIAYTSLAKADSWLYLLMECIYDVVFVLMLRYGYSQMGLTGAGIALSAAALFDLLMIGGVYGLYYQYRMRMRTFVLIIPQGILLLVTVLACMMAAPMVKYATGVCCFILSVLLSLRLLSSDNTVIQKVNSKFRK